MELKSDVNPATKTGAAKVAKFILAAANRDPTDAGRKFGGHAILLLGVGPGSRKGLPPMENLTIRRLIDPFLGNDGPAWDVVRISGTDGQVLAIVVDPPKIGDPIFVARKSGDEIRDGQIYVRVDGASEPNTSAQFDRLVSRSQPVAIGPQLEISLIGELSVYTFDESIFSERLHSIESEYLRGLPVENDVTAYPSALTNALRAQARISALSALSRPEDRTEEGFRDEVKAYLDDCRSDFPVLVDRVIGKLADPIAVRVVNRNDQFLTSVEVNLHIEGAVESIRNEHPDYVSYHGIFESAPRKWGPYTVDLGFNTPLVGYSATHSPIAVPDPSSWSNFDNGGSIEGAVGFKEIRPRARVQEETDLNFVVRDPSLEVVHVTWSATFEDIHDVLEGWFDVTVGPPVDITSELSEALDDAL